MMRAVLLREVVAVDVGVDVMHLSLSLRLA
jgi:hypothetical protein